MILLVRGCLTFYNTHIHTNNRVREQKKQRNADTLDATRVTLLNSIGFDFTMYKPHSCTWDKNFAELKEYYEKNGNDAEYNNQRSRRMYAW